MAEILVVEDDAPQRSQIAVALVRSGHRVDEALGGNEALSRLHGNRYDLLLTDLLMDQGTGFDVLERVRENAPGLPVLICSSYAKAENLKTFLHGNVLPFYPWADPVGRSPKRGAVSSRRGERNACLRTSFLGWRRGQEPSEHMAGLSLSYEECAALREAAERVPVGKRSEPLVSALRILCAVMAAVERGRAMMDQEDTPSPADSSS